LRIIFMGSALFSLPSLELLLQSGHQVVGVVTRPDRPKGRGRKIGAGPVKELAQRAGLPLLQPEDLRDPVFLQNLWELRPDLGVVVAFRILPPEVFTIPSKGTINLHASLLPRYRGAAPINWAIIRGEKVTGVTTFFINERVDTGKVILQRSTQIGDQETAGQLAERLSRWGAEVLLETVELIDQGRVKPREQPDGEATPAPKLKKSDGLIDWSQSSEAIRNLVRSLNPEPGAFTYFRERILKIHKVSHLHPGLPQGKPGQVSLAEKRFLVSTGDGLLSLDEVQPQDRGRMKGEEFLRGYRPKPKETLG